MRNTLVVAERELRAYFLSPIAYIVIAMFLLLSGYLFGLILNQQQEATLQPLFSNVSVLFLFIIPILSMRLLSEEFRSGTVELLLTNPVQEWEIVLGKFLGSLGVLVVMLLLSLLFPAFLFIFGNPDRGPILTGYLGILLQCAGFLGVGLWASSLSQNQIIAAVFAFAGLLILWLCDNLGQFIQGPVGSAISYLSVTNHMQQFPNGVIALGDVVFWLTLAAGGVALSTLALQGRRLQ